MKLCIGENIRCYRQKMSITQENLAEALGVSCQAISRWETGAAYPDIEMIPRIARFFSVSADVLMGIDKVGSEEKKEEYIRSIERLKSSKKYEEAFSLAEEARHEFPDDWDVVMTLCRLLFLRINTGGKDYLPELRRYCGLIWEECTDRSIQMEAIEMMVCAAEDEAETEEWIRKSQFGKTVYDLRLARCEFRGEWEERECVKESMNLEAILKFCFNMRPRWCGPEQSVEGNLIALQLLDVVSERNGSDAFLWDYAFYNTRLCAGLFACGRVEEGYEVMEKAVEMLERWFAIPDGTEIPYNCYCFRNLTYVKTSKRFDFFERKSGWAWFNNVRGEERYKALADRIAACNRKIG